jgi:hypothetical protein
MTRTKRSSRYGRRTKAGHAKIGSRRKIDGRTRKYRKVSQSRKNKRTKRYRKQRKVGGNPPLRSWGKLRKRAELFKQKHFDNLAPDEIAKLEIIEELIAVSTETTDELRKMLAAWAGPSLNLPLRIPRDWMDRDGPSAWVGRTLRIPYGSPPPTAKFVELRGRRDHPYYKKPIYKFIHEQGGLDKSIEFLCLDLMETENRRAGAVPTTPPFSGALTDKMNAVGRVIPELDGGKLSPEQYQLLKRGRKIIFRTEPGHTTNDWLNLGYGIVHLTNDQGAKALDPADLTDEELRDTLALRSNPDEGEIPQYFHRHVEETEQDKQDRVTGVSRDREVALLEREKEWRESKNSPLRWQDPELWAKFKEAKGAGTSHEDRWTNWYELAFDSMSREEQQKELELFKDPPRRARNEDGSFMD